MSRALVLLRLPRKPQFTFSPSRDPDEPFFTGNFVWGKDANGEPIIHKGKHPIVCPKPRFQRVQDILDGKRNIKTRKRHYVFQRFAICGLTNNFLSVTTNKGIPYYRSRNLQGAKYYPEKNLDKAFVDFLNQFVPKPELIEELKKHLSQKIEHRHSQKQNHLVAKGRQIQAYKMQLENMKTTFRNGQMPYSEFQEHQNEITAKIEEIESKTKSNIPKSKEESLTNLDSVVELLEKLSQSYFRFPPTIKAKFARILLSNLIVTPKKVTLMPVSEVQALFELGNSSVAHQSSELSKFVDRFIEEYEAVKRLAKSLQFIFESI